MVSKSERLGLLSPGHVSGGACGVASQAQVLVHTSLTPHLVSQPKKPVGPQFFPQRAVGGGWGSLSSAATAPAVSGL